MNKTFIAYNIETFVILAFITNNYSTYNDAKQVFQNFENYDVVGTDIDMPEDYTKYKVVFTEDGLFTGIERLTQEEIINIDPKEDGYNAAMILLGGEE